MIRRLFAITSGLVFLLLAQNTQAMIYLDEDFEDGAPFQDLNWPVKDSDTLVSLETIRATQGINLRRDLAAGEEVHNLVLETGGTVVSMAHSFSGTKALQLASGQSVRVAGSGDYFRSELNWHKLLQFAMTSDQATFALPGGTVVGSFRQEYSTNGDKIADVFYSVSFVRNGSGGIDVIEDGVAVGTIEGPGHWLMVSLIANSAGDGLLWMAYDYFAQQYKGPQPTGDPINGEGSYALIPHGISLFVNGDLPVAYASGQELGGNWAGEGYVDLLTWNIAAENGGTLLLDEMYWSHGLHFDQPDRGDGQESSARMASFDALPSRPVLTTPTGAYSTAPFEVTAYFGEPVDGFTAEDVAIEGGEAESFAGSGSEYSWTVIPSSDGLVTVQIPEGAAVYTRTQLSTQASGALQVFHDTVPPPVPAAPQPVGVTSNRNHITFSWPETPDPDPGSGIAFYDLQAGTSPGGNDLFDANVGNALMHEVSGDWHQTLYARVRAVDRAGHESAWSPSSQGIFLNRGPNIDLLSVVPESPGTLDDVASTATASDPDGDMIAEYRFEWRHEPWSGEGIVVEGPMLSHNYTEKGQPWACVAWARDEYGAWSEWATVASFMIWNTLPTQPLVEIKPDPVQTDEDLIVDVQVYSTDPDGDEIAYNFDWYKSADQGQTWIHKVELKDSPQVSHLYLNEGEQWQIFYTPYEVDPFKTDAGDETKRVEGSAGWDKIFVGNNTPPHFAWGEVRGEAWPGGGIDLDIAWLAGDADGEHYTVDLYWLDPVQGGLRPIAMGLAPDTTTAKARVNPARYSPIRLHAIVTDAKGDVTQSTSERIVLRMAARADWNCYQ